ncbi:MAG TPA: hypothetical protein VFY05_04755 [Candidatus Angelobacter sp.]|nr:hypothetical protein [Candidatus Angelobacter sp.]
MRPPDLKPPDQLAAQKPHGTRIKYIAGCRCSECREANSQYEKQRRFLAETGRGNPLVSAKPARLHLMGLYLQKMPRRTVEELSGVPHSILQLIKSGKRCQIRKHTAEKIMSVKGNYVLHDPAAKGPGRQSGLRRHPASL